MDRRRLLQIVVAAIPSLPSIWSWIVGPRRSAAATRSLRRIRPGDPEWPPKQVGTGSASKSVANF